MASRKLLKKNVKSACAELLFDCVALKLTGQVENAKLDALMVEVLNINNEFVSRLSHIEKGSEKAFFKQFCQQFVERTNTLSDAIAQA